MVNVFCIRPKAFNIGNDVIFQGTLAFLQRSFGSRANVISLPATSRYESENKAGLTARTVHEINQYGDGVIVGGGNLYENGELQVEEAALDALEVPLMLFSLGYGRIYNRRHELVPRTDAMATRTIAMLNRKACCSLVRDDATAGHLRTAGCRDVQVGGCPTLFLEEVADRIPASRDVPEVLVSVRSPALMNIPLADQSRVRSDILDLVDLLKCRGYGDVKLLCHDHRDLAFAASFGDIEYLYTDDVFTYLGWLRSCELNVGYRLHAVVPCLAFGTPTIAISYDERALSVLETVGYAAWNIDMIACDDVISEVENRLERVDELRLQRVRAADRWHSLRETTFRAFQVFAGEVLKDAGNKEKKRAAERELCLTSPSC